MYVHNVALIGERITVLSPRPNLNGGICDHIHTYLIIPQSSGSLLGCAILSRFL
jgi:hypothetical protein